MGQQVWCIFVAGMVPSLRSSGWLNVKAKGEIYNKEAGYVVLPGCFWACESNMFRTFSLFKTMKEHLKYWNFSHFASLTSTKSNQQRIYNFPIIVTAYQETSNMAARGCIALTEPSVCWGLRCKLFEILISITSVFSTSSSPGANATQLSGGFSP